MSKKKIQNFVYSLIGLVILWSIVTVLAKSLLHEDDSIPAIIVVNFLLTGLSIRMWTNPYFFSGKNQQYNIETWQEWLGIFFLAAIVSCIFLLIDCGGSFPSFNPELVCNGHPGIDIIFTISALAITAIAIPSAVRAWLISRTKNEF
ncbi:hypothetical protein ACO0K9_24755 [Undibacterium sp. Ji50W]|uniref:hypothetical protein n=1 Tax=Undibacterium sp. Ji50W TaxID=3413041 RepID=UPI003BF1D8C2